MNASNHQGGPAGLARIGSDAAHPEGRSSLTRAVNARSKDAVRALWYSNAPWAGTGYGQQTQQAVKRLTQDGHEIAVHAIYGLEGSTSVWNGIKIYPRGVTPYSDEIVAAHWQEWTQATNLPKLLMTLFDVWVLKAPNINTIPNIASWVPIDHQPCPPDVFAWCNKPNVMPIAMSKFGKQELDKMGVRSLYVPHGIEDVYKPTHKVVDSFGKEITGREIMGFKEDQFVVMMTAANKGVYPPRKAFPENFMAFAIFAQRHPDAVLFMHSDESGSMGGIDLKTLAQACGIPADRIRYADPYLYRMGLPQNAMAALYTDADVLLSTSMGEGFGIPVVEAQACGTPVIVSNFTAQPELCGDGWVVDGQPFWDAAQKSFFLTPSVPGIVDALEQAYKRGRNRSPKAISFGKQYEADKVYQDHWKPAMKEIAEWCRSSQS